MGFRSRSRKGFGDLINPYIRVRGTLDTPRLSIGKSGTALTGGAAAITGGLSILAQAALDRTFRAKDPCGKALAEARAGQTK